MRARNLLATLAFVLLAACKKGDESLVIANVTSAQPLPAVMEVTIAVGGIWRVFATPMGLSTTPVRLGVYIPGNHLGDVLVEAKAGIGECPPFSAGKMVTVARAGETVTVDLVVGPNPDCEARDGGADGRPGADAPPGTDGPRSDGPLTETGAPDGPGADGRDATVAADATRDTGTVDLPSDRPPPPGPPPTLGANTCKEYSHDDGACPMVNNQPGGTMVDSLAFSPDGTLLATAGLQVKLWKVTANGIERDGRVFSSAGRAQVAFSPDGKYLAIGSANGRLDLWDLATMSARMLVGGHNDQIWDVDFSSNGRRLLTVGGDNVLIVWSLDNFTSVRRVPLPATPNGIDVEPAPTGATMWTVVGLSGMPTQLIDLESTPLVTRTIPLMDAESVAFSPTGTTLALGADDGSLTLWDVSNKNQIAAMGPPVIQAASNQQIYALAYSPAGNHVAAGVWARGLTVFSLQPRALLPEQSTRFGTFSLSFSPDGRGLAAGLRNCGAVVYCR